MFCTLKPNVNSIKRRFFSFPQPLASVTIEYGRDNPVFNDAVKATFTNIFFLRGTRSVHNNNASTQREQVQSHLENYKHRSNCKI